MNQKLNLELYRSPMCVDPMTLSALLQMRLDIRNGTHSIPTEKSNQFGLIQGAVNVPRGTKTEQKSIAVYNFDGVLTKAGGESHHGTAEIADEFAKNDADESVGCHLFKVNSGGGTTTSVRCIREVTEVRTKPLVVYIEDMGASAAYWILSNADYIIADNELTDVGSIGTMVEFMGRAANTESPDGDRTIRVYATKSVNKNADFEKALNDFDMTSLVTEWLDPTNNLFLATVQKDRPNITQEHLSGKLYRASQVVGSLIDEIAPFSQAIAKCVELITFEAQKNNKLNSKNMNASELLAQHPQTYAEVLAIGAAQGRAEFVAEQKAKNEMLNSLGFQESAPKAYAKQLASGLGVTAEFLAEARLEEKASSGIAAAIAGNPALTQIEAGGESADKIDEKDAWEIAKFGKVVSHKK